MVTLERRFTPQKEVGSDAFRTEYKDVPTQVIIDDVVSYFGEYRFSLPKYAYNFKFTSGQLMDPNRNESMEEITQRAIDLKNRQGKSSIREQAEKIGFQNLNRYLAASQTGDTIIWASPPGPKSEGYGDYGFVYFGKVEDENNIKMVAIRVENPSMQKFRQTMRELTGENIEYESAEEFLDSPRVVRKDLKEGNLDAVLKDIFNFQPNEEEQKKFEEIISKMSPMIKDFANNQFRKREDLYALENCALALKKENYIYERIIPSNLQDLGVTYRNEPPKAAGSCGSTSSSSTESNNIFNSLSNMNSLFSENSKWFTCPRCKYQADGPIGDGPCPGCGLTKEEFQEEAGGEICE